MACGNDFFIRIHCSVLVLHYPILCSFCRLFRKNIFGAADEIELMFMDRCC